MNKKKAWILSLSMATMITANGLVMAAALPEQTSISGGSQRQTTSKAEFGKKGEKQGFQKDNKALLEFLNMDEKTFQAAMKSGKSLVAIAKEHGVSEQALKNLLIQEMSQRIDEAVTAGKVSSDKADKIKSNMEKRVSDMINSNGLLRGHGQMGHSLFANAKLLDLLKIDEASLKDAMKSGKSLVAIAKEHGVSEQTLQGVLIQEMSKRVDEEVTKGKIASDKAGEIKANIEKRVSDIINSSGPMRGHDMNPTI